MTPPKEVTPMQFILTTHATYSMLSSASGVLRISHSPYSTSHLHPAPERVLAAFDFLTVSLGGAPFSLGENREGNLVFYRL